MDSYVPHGTLDYGSAISATDLKDDFVIADKSLIHNVDKDDVELY